MLRTIVILGALFLAAAKGSDEYLHSCAIHSVAVVDELLDSSIYIWAAVKRCGGESEALRCEVDVASAVESVTKAMSIMVGALSECGALKHTECGETAGQLTAGLAGLAAASGEIAIHCPAPTLDTSLAPPPPPATGMPALQIAQCAIDVKGSMRSIFEATSAFMTVKEQCKEGATGGECTENVLKIVAAFASMGGFLTGAAGECRPMEMDRGLECTRAVTELIEHLSIVSRTGISISRECSSHDESSRRRRRRKSSSVAAVAAALPVVVPVLVSGGNRLYEDDETGVKATLGSKGVNLALVALLPITAFVSFVAGWKRHARRQQYEDLREVDLE